MKIRLAISLLMVCAMLSSQAQSKKLIRTYGIQKQIETTIKFKDGIEEKRYVSETESFNEDGEWIELVDYNSKGEIKSIETRQYVKRVLVEESKDRQKAKSEGEVFYERHTYQYVKGNVEMKQTFNKAGDLVKRHTYTYNGFDDVETETRFDADGNIDKQISYVYDDKGLKTEKHEKDATGALLETKLYAYE